jgi:site-specific DNA-methyltransferase (adenine-specific)
MEKDAAAAGFYETGGLKFLKLQILTAAQVIDGTSSRSIWPY